VYYGAGRSEAAQCAGQDVVVVGAGNSAGQAGLNFANQPARVTMLVRGDRLAKSMSAYLIERIEHHPLIDVRLETQLTGLHASGGPLEAVTFTDSSGRDETRRVDGAFLCLGGRPHTEWGPRGHVITDDRGFILTRPDLRGQAGPPGGPGLPPPRARPGGPGRPAGLLAARARPACTRDEPGRALRRRGRAARVDQARRSGRRRGVDGRLAHLQPPCRARCHLLSSRTSSSTRAREPRPCSSRSTTMS